VSDHAGAAHAGRGTACHGVAATPNLAGANIGCVMNVACSLPILPPASSRLIFAGATARRSRSPRMSSIWPRAERRSSAISWARRFGSGRFAAVLEGFVAQPEQVEAHLVAGDDLVVVECRPPTIGVLLRPGRLALLALGGLVAGDELVEVGPRHAGLEGADNAANLVVNASMVVGTTDPGLARLRRCRESSRPPS
jgi:hypothetical protein